MQSDPLDAIQRLSLLANEEASPPTKIDDRIVAALQSYHASPVALDRHLLFAGAGSFVAACIALLLFWSAVKDDSFVSFAQPFITVMP